MVDTISILRGLKERYEVHHGVKIADNALVAAALLSNRYISDRFLPDKAIDLVDEANSVSLGFENCLLRNAAAKVPNNAVRLSGEKCCNQMSWLRLIHFVYSIHLLHVLDSLSLVFFVTPFSLCTSAARRSATRVFLAGDGRF